MGDFCPGEPFWDSNLTLSSSWPRLTQCFIDTALVLAPCGGLWVATPIYVVYLSTLVNRPYKHTPLQQVKLFAGIMLCILGTIDIISAFSEKHKREESVYINADILAPMVRTFTFILAVVLVVLERRKSLITSGVLFLFWFFMAVINIVPFYTHIILQTFREDMTSFCVFYISYVFTLVQFVAHCFAEKSEDDISSTFPCPEVESSYLSRLTFYWTTGLMLEGYKKSLTELDVYDLHPREQSDNVIRKFDQAVDSIRGLRTKPRLMKECSVRYTDSTTSLSIGYHANRKHESKPLGAEDTESTPLLSSERGSPRSLRPDHGPMPPLWRILCRMFGVDALLAQIWKVVSDVLMLSSPLILRALINFATDLNSPEWVGYLLSLALLVSVTIQAITFHVLNHYSMAIGIRVRAALISAIFRKGLTINNEASKECTAGEIVNLMSVDVTRIQKYTEQLYWIWAAPVEVIVCLYLLYTTLGDAMFAGLAFLLVTIATNIVLMTRMGGLQAQLMRIKDKRMRLVNEVLNGIKILKLYAWEESFRDKIDRIRRGELQIIWKIAVLQAVLIALSVITPFCVGLFTFVTFIFLNDSHTLDAATAFVGLSLFNTMKTPLSLAPRFFSDTAKCFISVGRVNRFLQLPDLKRKSHITKEDGYPIIVSNGTFSWDFDRPPTLTNINLRVPEGSLVAVVGQVGSGKTSLISAIVGDMETISGRVTVNGRVAYSPQQAWIQNDTVQNNILFGKEMHRRNYIKVIDACALKQDIDNLPGKDKTEIGEKGINLSGGQKQRVSLARAVYNDADIYLLDDPLSAVDSHVGKHIFTKVIGKTGLLMHKTRVLVTHGVHWLPHVDVIVVMTDGRVSEMGSYNSLLSHHGAFSQFLMTYFTEPKDQSDGGEDEFVQEMQKAVFERLRVLHSAESEGSAEEDVFEKTIDRMRRASLLEGLTSSTRLTLMRRRDSRVQIKDLDKLIEEESVQAGMVKKAVYATYGNALGVMSAVVVILSYLLYQAGSVGGSVWLSTWTDDPKLTNISLPPDSPDRGLRTDFFMGIYGLFGIIQIVTVTLSTLLLGVSSVRASRSIHAQVLAHVLRAPMSFFDTTPIGRILNRFSQDIDTIDNELPLTLISWIGRVCTVLSTIIVISYTTPIFLAAVLPISILYTFIQRFYIPTSRQLRRLESKTRSPIYAHFGETLTGSSVIRAYRAEERFIRHSEKLVDMNQKFTFASNTSNRWLGVRMEMLGAVVVFLASLLSVLTRSSRSGGTVGLSISYALDITISLNWLVRLTSDIETQIVAIERLKEYTETETEAPLRRQSTCPPSDWPGRGEVQFERYSTRFRPGLDLVLRGITCKIRPGEKVGVVGRTGAGKSSLALALFRLVEPAGGDILIDGYSIRNLGLHSLRERITILPQDPVIFDGTLRMNLDPFGQSRDNQMWVALGQAKLKDFVERLPTGLDYECGEGGENLSVGQRQLVCLARTLLRKTRILVLDEATAAVDLETDDLIQQTIRSEFKQCTVISIAHRLNTIMDYDRVMVLDKGRIVDFNPPEIMLRNTSSLFYKLAKDANII